MTIKEKLSVLNDVEILSLKYSGVVYVLDRELFQYGEKIKGLTDNDINELFEELVKHEIGY